MRRQIRLWAGSIPTGARESCVSCGWHEGELKRYVKTNGAVALRWFCGRCDGHTSFTDIPHSFLSEFGLTIDDLPVGLDASGTGEPCAICGLRTTEWHHWASRKIFDWEKNANWSTVGAYLCKAHHDEWHEVMRQHGFRWPHELRIALER